MVLSAFSYQIFILIFPQNLKMILQRVIDKLCLLSKVASRSISSSQRESTLHWYATESQKPSENFLPQPLESDNDNTLITTLKFRLCWLKSFPELTSHSEFGLLCFQGEATEIRINFWVCSVLTPRQAQLEGTSPDYLGFSLGFYSNHPIPSKTQRR